MELKFRLFKNGYGIAIDGYCGGYVHDLRPLPGEDWLAGQ